MNEKCNTWWHVIFHMWKGTDQSVTTCLRPGSRPRTDYHFSKYSCGICKKRWIVDHAEEDRRYEQMRDEAIPNES